jgi:hypothetical protein
VRARQEVRRLTTEQDPRADVDVHGGGERTDVPEYRDGALADATPTHGTRIASSAIQSDPNPRTTSPVTTILKTLTG